MRDKNSEQYIANKVSIVTLIINLVLSVFKVIAGVIGHSGAMISDAVHSASDVMSTVVVIIGVNLSKKDEDNDHQYGHEKIECICAIILSIMLFITAVGIGWAGIKNIIFIVNGGKIKAPGLLPLIAAIVSIVVKEWMYWYTRIAAKKIDSQALLADAWHHRSDALSSVGSLLGIGGAMLGFVFLDPLVSIIIALLIVKVSYDIARASVDQLVDKAADDETTELIRRTVSSVEGVKRIDELKTRSHATKLFVDVEIAVDGDLTMREAHDIAEKVHDDVEQSCPRVKHIMVHVNPYE